MNRLIIFMALLGFIEISHEFFISLDAFTLKNLDFVVFELNLKTSSTNKFNSPSKDFSFLSRQRKTYSFPKKTKFALKKGKTFAWFHFDGLYLASDSIVKQKNFQVFKFQIGAYEERFIGSHVETIERKILAIRKKIV